MSEIKAVTPGGREGDDSPFSSSTTSNWVARQGGLNPYVREVAHALVRKGHSESQAIQIAWGVIRNWAEGKGKVSAKVRAGAAAAVADMDRKRAASHAESSKSDLDGADGLMHEIKSTPWATEVKVDPGDTGVVECLVAVPGVVDNVNDIIEPGALTKALLERTPKGVSNHDWKVRTNKALQIEEWMPGDKRLPKETADGKPWPAKAGALYVKAQYNLDTDDGRKAYSNVKFDGKQAQFSIGYRVAPGGAYQDTKTGIRHIKKLSVYEYSDVLWGAAPLSMALSAKSDEVKDVSSGMVAATGQLGFGKRASWTCPNGCAAGAVDKNGAMVCPTCGSTMNQSKVEAEAAGSIERLLTTLAAAIRADVTPATTDTIGDSGQPWASIVATHPDHVVYTVYDGGMRQSYQRDYTYTDGDIPTVVLGEPTPVTLQTTLTAVPTPTDALDDEDFDDLQTKDTDMALLTAHSIEGDGPFLVKALDGRTITECETKEAAETWMAVWNEALLDEVKDFTEEKKDRTDKEVEALGKNGMAMANGDGTHSFPIENEADLHNAIQAIGRAKDPAKAKAWIKKRAADLQATNAIPDDWADTKDDRVTLDADLAGDVLAFLEDKSEFTEALHPRRGGKFTAKPASEVRYGDVIHHAGSTHHVVGIADGIPPGHGSRQISLLGKDRGTGPDYHIGMFDPHESVDVQGSGHGSMSALSDVQPGDHVRAPGSDQNVEVAAAHRHLRPGTDRPMVTLFGHDGKEIHSGDPSARIEKKDDESKALPADLEESVDPGTAGDVEGHVPSAQVKDPADDEEAIDANEDKSAKSCSKDPSHKGMTFSDGDPVCKECGAKMTGASTKDDSFTDEENAAILALLA